MKTLTVGELIEQLSEMPQNWKVYSWEGDKRVPISEVVNVGDVVDLYNYENTNEDDEDFALVAEYEDAQHAMELEDFDNFAGLRDNTDPITKITGQTDKL
jgi:hypothetical protein